MNETKLNPCPKCNGEITLFVNINRGVFARCGQCKSEFDVCGTHEVPTYHGIRIRKSTIRKVNKMWNRRATDG